MRYIAIVLIVGLLGCSSSSETDSVGRVSGRITTSSGAPRVGHLVGIQPPILPSAVTDEDGRYTFANVPAGDYLVAPFDPEDGSTASPNDQIIRVGGPVANVDFTVTNGTGLGTIRGEVTYTGSRTGRVYIYLITGLPSLSPHGTSRIGPGPFEIRGVRPGSYFLTAYMAINNTTELHAHSPVHYGGEVTVTANGAVNANIPLEDPAPFEIPAPDGLVVLPMNTGASIQYDPSRHQGHDAGIAYNLYWGPTPDIGPGMPDNAAPPERINPWPGGQPAIYVHYDQTDGDVLYYRVTALGDGDIESPPTDAFGPVVIGKPENGPCVSGVVTFADGFVPGGPVTISAESPRFYEPFADSWVLIEDPQAVQPYRVCNLPKGPYILIVRVDTDRDGHYWEYDPSQEFYDGIDAPFLQLEDEDIVADATFSPPPSANRLNTRTVEYPNGALRFEVQAELRQVSNLPARVTLTPPSGLPMDLHTGRFPERDGVIAYLNTDYGPFRPSETPWVFDAEYLSGLTKSFSLSPRFLDNPPTPLAPNGTASGGPLRFEWAAPDPPPDYDHVYFVTVRKGNDLYWASPAIGSDRRSVEFGDGGARELVDENLELLTRDMTSGTYQWEISLRSTDGDWAGRQAEFQYQP